MVQNPKKFHFTLQVFYGGPTFFGRRFLFHNKSRRYKLDNFFLLVIFFKFFSLKLSDSSRFLIKNDLGPLSHFDTLILIKSWTTIIYFVSLLGPSGPLKVWLGRPFRLCYTIWMPLNSRIRPYAANAAPGLQTLNFHCHTFSFNFKNAFTSERMDIHKLLYFSFISQTFIFKNENV